ncbi:phage tail protein, partial [Leisingera sp. MMG026]|uniref:phage tail-collar fiber domain-containing protein n=1 Tax=Leisingera sp. MMG026 TaxID=2909982 RepID=UPI001F305665
MPLNGVQIITSTGQDKLAQALSSGQAVQITEVGLGDGNGLRYNPSEGQTALKNERVRRAITKQH